MEWKLVDGDYIPNGTGGLTALSGGEEVLARVLYRLTARRGAFPFLPELGSRLYQLGRESPSARQALAVQYVAEALREEKDLKVEDRISECPFKLAGEAFRCRGGAVIGAPAAGWGL